MSEDGMHDWDAALEDLLNEEEIYSRAADLYDSWTKESYGSFTKLDAVGTVAIAVVGYLAGYPNVRAFVDDMDAEALAWIVELLDSAILQGVLIGMGSSAPKGSDAIYMSPEIIKFLDGEGYESRFNPPAGYNPNAEEEG